jgi:hypothetical protein
MGGLAAFVLEYFPLASMPLSLAALVFPPFSLAPFFITTLVFAAFVLAQLVHAVFVFDTFLLPQLAYTVFVFDSFQLAQLMHAVFVFDTFQFAQFLNTALLLPPLAFTLVPFFAWSLSFEFAAGSNYFFSSFPLASELIFRSRRLVPLWHKPRPLPTKAAKALWYGVSRIGFSLYQFRLIARLLSLVLDS